MARPRNRESEVSVTYAGNPGAIRKLASECRVAGADSRCPALASSLLAEAATALEAYAEVSARCARPLSDARS